MPWASPASPRSATWGWTGKCRASWNRAAPIRICRRRQRRRRRGRTRRRIAHADAYADADGRTGFRPCTARPRPAIVPNSDALNLRNLDAAETAASLAPFGVEPRRRPAGVRAGAPGWSTNLDGVRGLSHAQIRAIPVQSVWPELEVIERRRAADGFVKYLFRLADGPPVEAVRIPLPDPAERRARLEGAPARRGWPPVARSAADREVHRLPQLAGGLRAGLRLLRDRQAGLQAQPRDLGDRRAGAASRAPRPTAPCAAWCSWAWASRCSTTTSVIRAARILCHPAGLAISAKAITISTAGVVPGIRRYTARGAPVPAGLLAWARHPREARAGACRSRSAGRCPSWSTAIRDYAAATGAAGDHRLRGHRRRQHSAAKTPRRWPRCSRRPQVKMDLIDVTDPTGKYRRPRAEELEALPRPLQTWRARGAALLGRQGHRRRLRHAGGVASGRRVGRGRPPGPLGTAFSKRPAIS